MLIQNSVGEIIQIRFGKKQPGTHKDNPEKLLVEAVDTVFSSLGDPCKQAFYFYLKHFRGVSKHEIPHRIEDLADALEEVFGPGARLIEIKIMKVLFSKVRTFTYSLRHEELSFTDYVERLCGF